MKRKTVSTFRKLFEVLDQFRSKNEDWMFRGHADADWKLVPKAGRDEYRGVDDLELLRHWQKRAGPLVTPQPGNDWDWLTLAQHHGLATRLLDWTVNPLAATFFAVADKPSKNAALFCFLADHDSQYLSMLPQRIEDVRDVRVLLPRPVSPRVDRQMGRFTIHPNPHESISIGTIVKVVIKASAKRQIQADLNYFGVNQSTLFPDLDGLSAFSNWFFQTYRAADGSRPIPDVPRSVARKSKLRSQPHRKVPAKRAVKKDAAKRRRG